MFLADAPTQPLIRTVALPRERKLLKKIAYHGAIVGLFLFIVLYVLYTLLGSNFHVVIPGCAYRSAQLSPETLESIISSYKIRTVLNLKGCSDPMAWYLDEAKVAAKLNVSLEDLGMSAGRLPSVAAVRDLVPILERSEYPILIHCNRGIDRTGLVSTMLLLLRTDTSLAQARQQLSLLHGHLALSHTGNMDRFYDLYEQWLTRKGQSHSRNNFRLWLLYDYCPGECSCAFEVVNLRGAPALLPKDHAFALRVKCHNTSVGAWHFRPGSNAGIHAAYAILNDQDVEVYRSKAGLFQATVHPGSSIELDLALPGLPPGRYTLRADLYDEQHASFYQTGSEPLIMELEVL